MAYTKGIISLKGMDRDNMKYFTFWIPPLFYSSIPKGTSSRHRSIRVLKIVPVWGYIYVYNVCHFN